ncbi:MAG: hypothetical protein WC473_04930 [Patescibacteria group bacterium]
MEKIKNITQVKTETGEAGLPVSNKAKTNKIKLDWFWLARLMYPLTIVAIIIILFAVMSFLYQEVYQTATQMDMLAGLKSKVIEVQINGNSLNQIKELLCRKTSTPAVWPFKNPFVFSQIDPPLRPSNDSWSLTVINNLINTSTVSSTAASSTTKTTTTIKN